MQSLGDRVSVNHQQARKPVSPLLTIEHFAYRVRDASAAESVNESNVVSMEMIYSSWWSRQAMLKLASAWKVRLHGSLEVPLTKSTHK